MYDLQFFAEGENEDDMDTSGDISGAVDNDSSDSSTEISAEAFADLISDRDKKIETMEAEIKALKKSNAELLVKISNGGDSQGKTFEENLLNLVGYKPRKEK